MSLFPELYEKWPAKGSIFVHRESGRSAMVTSVIDYGDGTDLFVVLNDEGYEFELNEYTFYDWMVENRMKMVRRSCD